MCPENNDLKYPHLSTKPAFEILFSDPALLVVNKSPAWLPSPKAGINPLPNLAGLLEAEFGRLWIVHRLDKVTSGVMVFARTAAAHRTLNLLFERARDPKGISRHRRRQSQMGRTHRPPPAAHQRGHSHRTVVDHSKGKPSETAFRVLEHFDGYALTGSHPENRPDAPSPRPRFPLWAFPSWPTRSTARRPRT